MLVEKGYSMAYDPAIALAMKTIEAANDNYLVISSVLDLLNALVEKKIAVDQAV